MNGRERFLRVLNFQPVDRLPNYELGFWPQTLDRWAKEGLSLDQMSDLNWFDGDPYFGLERRCYANINIWLMPPFDEEVLEEDERYILARNGQGILTKALKEGTSRGGRMCMDTYLEWPVKDRETFRQLTKTRYNPDAVGRYPKWWDQWVKIWKDRDYPLCLLNNGTFGLYSGLRSWVGTESISYLFYDDPDFVEEMLDFNTDFLLKVVDKALKEVRFDYFNFFEDFAGKGTPLVSPSIFRQFLAPRYKRIIEHFKKAGIEHFWMDSDGTVDTLIPDIIECGITCLWPMEQPSGMDPVRLRKEYGKDLAFAGGIAKHPLALGKKQIDEELQAKIPPLLDCGGYIPHLDHTFPPDISYENFLYYLEAKAKLIQCG